MRIPRLAGVIAGLFLFIPGTLSADVGLGGRLAFVRSDADADSRDRFMGGMFRVRMSPRTALELAIDWRSVTTEELNVRTREYPVQGTLLLYLARGGFAPYLLGGAGWYSRTIETLGADEDVLESASSRDFGWHAGFGAELRLGQHAGVHVDYRYMFVDFGNDDDEQAGDGSGLRVPILADVAGKLGLSHDGSMVTSGLTFYF
jgi:opacity protein-like surface antigen